MLTAFSSVLVCIKNSASKHRTGNNKKIPEFRVEHTCTTMHCAWFLADSFVKTTNFCAVNGATKEFRPKKGQRIRISQKLL